MENIQTNIVQLRNLLKRYLAGKVVANRYEFMLLLKSASPDVKHGLLTNLLDAEGATALHRALSERQRTVVVRGDGDTCGSLDLDSAGYMLEGLTSTQKFETLKEKNKFGATVLHSAAESVDGLKAVQFLLNDLGEQQIHELLTSVNKDQMTAIHIATCNKNRVKTLQVMLDKLTLAHRLHILSLADKHESTAVHLAAANCSPESVRVILYGLSSDQKFQIMTLKDYQGRSPLIIAMDNKYGAEEAVHSMLDDLTSEQKYEVLRIQGKKGLFDSASFYDSVLLCAIKRGNWEMVRQLLDGLTSKQTKALLSMKGENGKSVLLNLAELRIIKIVLGSLSSDDLLEVIDPKQGPSFLNQAFRQASPDVITYLIECKAAAKKAIDERGETKK